MVEGRGDERLNHLAHEIPGGFPTIKRKSIPILSRRRPSGEHPSEEGGPLMACGGRNRANHVFLHVEHCIFVRHVPALQRPSEAKQGGVPCGAGYNSERHMRFLDASYAARQISPPMKSQSYPPLAATVRLGTDLVICCDNAWRPRKRVCPERSEGGVACGQPQEQQTGRGHSRANQAR